MKTDFLVIGSGVAGLSFALRAAAHGTVRILTKATAWMSNTAHAQGGIATVWDKEDKFDLHVQDTLTAGAGLCNREAVELLTSDRLARPRWTGPPIEVQGT